MMTIKCDIVKDMLPLYLDDLCSEENRKLVDNHLKNCGKCREALSALKSNLHKKETQNLAARLEISHPIRKER